MRPNKKLPDRLHPQAVQLAHGLPSRQLTPVHVHVHVVVVVVVVVVIVVVVVVVIVVVDNCGA